MRGPTSECQWRASLRLHDSMASFVRSCNLSQRVQASRGPSQRRDDGRRRGEVRDERDPQRDVGCRMAAALSRMVTKAKPGGLRAIQMDSGRNLPNWNQEEKAGWVGGGCRTAPSRHKSIGCRSSAGQKRMLAHLPSPIHDHCSPRHADPALSLRGPTRPRTRGWTWLAEVGRRKGC